MCKGYYRESKPLIKLYLVISPSKTSEHSHEFLIDTGATKTTLSYPSARKLGIDLNSLEKDIVGGIGGSCEVYVFGEIGLVFLDYLDDEYTEFHIEPLESINIFNKKTQEAPNILGMDVLSRFNISLNSGGDISLKRNKDISPKCFEFKEKTPVD